MQIVIVDDEPVSLEMLKQLISKMPDSDVHAFAQAPAALTWCKSNEPDLVLVDYMMPDLNGIEFTKRLRAFPGRADTPVLMVTVQSDQEVRKTALRSGINDILSKPYDFSELDVRLRNMLALRASQKQRSQQFTVIKLPKGRKKQAEPLLDLEMTLKRLGGHRGALNEIARIFVSTVPHLLSTIRAALAHDDFEQALIHAGALKGAVAALEAPEVAVFVSRVETYARDYDGPSAVASFTMTQTLIERLLTELEPFVPGYLQPSAN